MHSLTLTQGLPETGVHSTGKKRVARAATAALLGLAALVCVWGVQQWPQVREQRISRRTLDSLLKEAPTSDDPILLYYAGMRLNRRGRFAEAAPLLEKGVSDAPETARLRDEWARALLGNGQTSRAFEELRQFVGVQPQSGDAHLLLGKFYQSQNAWKRAEEELTRAVSLDPKKVEAWSYLSAAHYGHGNVTAAIEAARKAADLLPRGYEAHLALASLLVGQRSPDAEEPLKQAIRLSPNDALAHIKYAEWLLNVAGQPATAVVEARQAAQIAPHNEQAFYLLGKGLIRLGDNAGAIAPLQTAAQLSPSDPNIAAELMHAFRAMRQETAANQWQAEYRKRERQSSEWVRLMNALVVDPQSRTLNQQLAALLARQGDVVGCVRHEAAALRCPPDASPALRAAADDLIAGGYAEEARKLEARLAHEDSHLTKGELK